MAEYRKFLRNVNYRHKSGAVAAYKAGMIIYLPAHILESPQLAGKTEPAPKPARKSATDDGEGDMRRVYIEDDWANS